MSRSPDELVIPADALRLLLVEDDEDCRLSLSMLLQAVGHQVTAVATCADARARLQTERYALVLLDVRLRDGSGLDLIPAVRALHPAAKVVIVSGSSEDAAPTSADAVILKGSDPEKMLATLEGMLQTRIAGSGFSP